jgi:hypothetical protein
MAALVQHGGQRHAPPDGQLLCYRNGRPSRIISVWDFQGAIAPERSGRTIGSGY